MNRSTLTVCVTAACMMLMACKPAAETASAPSPAAAPAAQPAAPAAEVPASAPAAKLVAMRAFGNEPFWEMIDNGDGSLTFTTPDNTKGDKYTAARSDDASGTHYSGTDVKLDIVKKDCSDGMSDATHPFTATMKLKGKDYTGCAAPASEVMEAEEATPVAADGGPVSAFHANGFSPAWTADIKGDSLSFEVPDFAGPDSNPRTIKVERSAYAKGVDYTGKDGKTSVAFSIKDGPCEKAGDENGKTGREFSATLTYGKTKYQGCADRR